MPRDNKLGLRELEIASQVFSEIKGIENIVKELEGLAEILIKEDKEMTFRILWEEDIKKPIYSQSNPLKEYFKELYGSVEQNNSDDKTMQGMDLFIRDTDRILVLSLLIRLLNRRKNKCIKALGSKGIEI